MGRPTNWPNQFDMRRAYLSAFGMREGMCAPPRFRIEIPENTDPIFGTLDGWWAIDWLTGDADQDRGIWDVDVPNVLNINLEKNAFVETGPDRYGCDWVLHIQVSLNPGFEQTEGTVQVERQIPNKNFEVEEMFPAGGGPAYDVGPIIIRPIDQLETFGAYRNSLPAIPCPPVSQIPS